MRWNLLSVRLPVMLLALLVTSAAVAQMTTETGDSGITCPKAHTFSGNMTSDICWDCFYPISIGGSVQGDQSRIPIDHASSTCTCPGRFFGEETEGPTLGMWQPTHVMELVREPYCSPIMDEKLQSSDTGSGGGSWASRLGTWGSIGTGSSGVNNNNQPEAYYNAHFFAFPVGLILDMFENAVCVSDAGYSATPLYMSEIDPMWNDPELSIYTTLEAYLFNNPIALMACIEDGIQTSLYQPNPYLFWCAGTWGGLYPFTGFTTQQGSPPRDSSLTGARLLAHMGRLGLASRSYGDGAVCTDVPVPIFPKLQYRLQMLYPIAERQDNHWIGETTWTWGEWRNIPAVGEDFVYLVWTYHECCGNP
jgi:conjugal transfer pilus assembly protein TraU